MGIPPEDTAFDVDIIAGINTTFMSLNQIGIGPETPYIISDNTAEWSDFSADATSYPAIKTYVVMKVRLFFDPPGTSFAITATAKLVEELEERLKLQWELLNPPEEIIEEEV